MSYLSIGEVETSEILWIVAAVTYSRIEVRHDCHEFCKWLPRTSRGYDAIWVIVDILIKAAHFLPIKKTYSTDRLAKLYINRIVCLLGVPVRIVYVRGVTFTSVFWQGLHKAMGTGLDFITAFHPQTDGQSKRAIQTLEDRLWTCMMNLVVNRTYTCHK